MNAQVIKTHLTMKVLFPSQVISMYEGKTFFCYLWPVVEHLLIKMCLDINLQLVFHLS